ncbi:2-succinyl-6-hydroxy-2,4-cyclohexadiene-1-carboxylate synthase [bacterium]|nr:2-succinyl-6-hydroxy-2,4-cyclohexadiene-1-carboxylate synthase [bacterium]
MRMHWTYHGDPDQPVLLLLHGFLGCGGDMAHVRRELADRHGCLVCNLPGHGEHVAGYAPADYTAEATAEALIGILDELEIARAHMLGYSLGGRVALYTALAHPGRCGRLVLESASAGLAVPALRRERRELDLRRAAELRAGGVEAFLRTWYDQPLFANLRERPELLRQLKRRLRSGDAEGLALSLESIGAGSYPSLWERLPELRMPVLLVCGARDAKFVALNREMAERLPDARLVVVPGVGHNVHLEEPRRFARIVGEFLAA